jgi:hypothetical protein
MWFHSVFALWRSSSSPARRCQPPRRRGPRLSLEQLEDRTLPSTFTAASVSDLVADINAANKAAGPNTIALVAGKTFSLAAVNNTTDGATGLPFITANDNLTIVGNGDTIERSTAKGTPAFRIFDVAGGASLTLANLTVQGGLASGGTATEAGGGIYNQGALTLSGVTIQNNTAQGGGPYGGGAAAGGGIYSSGSLTLEGGTTVRNNLALGANGLPGGYSGGSGLGGGVYVASGPATLANVSLTSNTAQGGNGGQGYASGWERYKVPGFGGSGGGGLGGGLYVAGGAVTLTGITISSNTAQGGNGGKGSAAAYNGQDGVGKGGGLYIASLATVGLDAFTVAHINHNHASTSNDDIYGSYTLLP